MTDKDFTMAVVECDELPNCLKNEILNMEQNETTLRGWVARDEYRDIYNQGNLALYSDEPNRDYADYNDIVFGFWDGEGCPLDNDLFPQITWDSEPCEVEITIKIKEK